MVADYYHKHNIRVNLDVVFNHVYRAENVAFNGLVPHYFFQVIWMMNNILMVLIVVMKLEAKLK